MASACRPVRSATVSKAWPAGGSTHSRRSVPAASSSAFASGSDRTRHVRMQPLEQQDARPASVGGVQQLDRAAAVPVRERGPLALRPGPARAPASARRACRRPAAPARPGCCARPAPAPAPRSTRVARRPARASSGSLSSQLVPVGSARPRSRRAPAPDAAAVRKPCASPCRERSVPRSVVTALAAQRSPWPARTVAVRPLGEPREGYAPAAPAHRADRRLPQRARPPAAAVRPRRPARGRSTRRPPGPPARRRAGPPRRSPAPGTAARTPAAAATGVPPRSRTVARQRVPPRPVRVVRRAGLRCAGRRRSGRRRRRSRTRPRARRPARPAAAFSSAPRVSLAHLAPSVSRYACAAPAAATEASSRASSPGTSSRACVRSVGERPLGGGELGEGVLARPGRAPAADGRLSARRRATRRPRSTPARGCGRGGRGRLPAAPERLRVPYDLRPQRRQPLRQRGMGGDHGVVARRASAMLSRAARARARSATDGLPPRLSPSSRARRSSPRAARRPRPRRAGSFGAAPRGCAAAGGTARQTSSEGSYERHGQGGTPVITVPAHPPDALTQPSHRAGGAGPAGGRRWTATPSATGYPLT